MIWRESGRAQQDESWRIGERATYAVMTTGRTGRTRHRAGWGYSGNRVVEAVLAGGEAEETEQETARITGDV